MPANGESVPFLEYLSALEPRFYQERSIGLDLYHSGWLGLASACLLISTLTVFALALFQTIPRRRTIVGILSGLGVSSLACGLSAAWWNFRSLPEGREELIRAHAGSLPITAGQEAAVVALPLVVGLVTLSVSVLGCLYLALFWTDSLLPGRGGDRDASSGGKRTKRSHRAGQRAR